MNRQQRRKAAKAARARGDGAGIAAVSPDVQRRFGDAVTLFQGGRLPDAEAALHEIDAAHPGIADVGHLRGVIALQLDSPERAVVHLEAATAANPHAAAPFTLLATAYSRTAETAKAIATFEKVLRLEPNSVDAHYNLATVLRDSGEPTAAAAHYRRAIELEPDFVDAHYNLGLALIDLEQYEPAVESLERASALAPAGQARGQADVHVSLAKAHNMVQRYSDGETEARAALAIDPDSMAAQSNLARALQGQGRTEEADEAMRRALALDADSPDLHANYGNILEDLGDAEAAESAYRRAIELDPAFSGAHSNLGLLLLLTGAYAEGWREYDWRWRREHWSPRPFPQPRWDGADLTEKTVLAWGDEGPGDEILFASLLPELIAASGACVVECAPRLVELFRRAFPRAEIHPRKATPEPRLLRDDIDCQTPFTELARRLRPDLSAAAKPDKPYLTADPDMAEACRARYRALGGGPRGGGPVVGIAWASRNLRRPDRNAPLPLWDPILRLDGLTFLSLQYGDHTAEIAEVRDRLGVTIHEDPDIDQLASLEQFAAQVDAVDIVVSITNTTVHMAGALGKTVWTMLPFMPDWRYRLGRDDTAWYPEMRLFRQRRARHWPEVIERVAGELAAFRDAAR